MTYSSILDAYGWERFAADAQHAGATSLIVADLPADVRPETRRIQLVAPTSTDERLQLAAGSTDGWLYLVTVTGTTGARAELAPTLAPLAARARARDDVPLYAGFGISTAEHARAAAEHVDGIVVGSRAVEAAEQGAAELAQFVGSLRAGTRQRIACSDAHVSVWPASRPSPCLRPRARRSRSSSASPPRRPPSAPSSSSSPRRSSPSIRPTVGCATLRRPATPACSRDCSNSRSTSPGPTPTRSERRRASTASGSPSASTSASAARSTTRCSSSRRTAGSPCTTASWCRRTTSAWSGGRATAADSRP